MKNAGEVVVDDDITLNVLSVFDRDNWTEPTDPGKINIALYHGAISNCQTDAGWTMEHGEDNLSIFEEFDFAMLGDIHKRQFLDKENVSITQALLFSRTTEKRTTRAFLFGQSTPRTTGTSSTSRYRTLARLLQSN